MSFPNNISSTSNPTTQSTNTRFNAQPQTLQPEACRSSNFVRRLILALVTLFVMVMIINSIAWLILHPRGPIISVNSISVSNVTQYDIELNIKNPNKKIDMLIDNFKIKVLHTRAWISPFYLRKMNQKNIKAKLGRGFNNKSEVWGQRRVKFDVEMEIRSRLRAWNRLTKRTLMGVLCKNLIVELSAKGTGKLIVGGKDCPLQFR